MKHIKKKYLFREKIVHLKTKVSNPGPIKNIDRRDSSLLKENKSGLAFMKTTDDYFIKGIVHNRKGKYTVVPIPDLTLVYFNNAYRINKLRIEEEEALFKKLLSVEEETEDVTNDIYNYYGYASSSLISLFTSLESFINHLIPDDGVYRRVRNNRTELHNKMQIQQNLNFLEKVKDVLPFFYDNKSFFRNTTPANELIKSLKNLRDDIVHTKSEINLENQEKLFHRLLKFKYDKSLEAVAKFMNFYKKDYISECDCGSDF